MLRFRHQGYQMKALVKVDEECQHLRHLKDHLRAEIAQNSHFTSLKWLISWLFATSVAYATSANGFSLKYRVVCSVCWVDLGLFTNITAQTCKPSPLFPCIRMKWHQFQARNGLSLKYRVHCWIVWPHHGLFTIFHNLQCYIRLQPRVRNGLSLKYRVHCSRVWPNLGLILLFWTFFEPGQRHDNDIA